MDHLEIRRDHQVQGKNPKMSAIGRGTEVKVFRRDTPRQIKVRKRSPRGTSNEIDKQNNDSESSQLHNLVNLNGPEQTTITTNVPVTENATGITNSEKNEENELLILLGDGTDITPKPGPPIHEKVAHLWETMCKAGLSKDIKKPLLDKYPIPSNCSVLKAPDVNSEIKTAMGKISARRDAYQSSEQNQLGTAISALGIAMSLMLQKDKTPETQNEIFETVGNAAKILVDLHHLKSLSRKAFITPGLSQLVMNIAKETKVDNLLYGQDFSERLKVAKEVEKTGKDVAKFVGQSDKKKTYPSFSRNTNKPYYKPRTDLNWESPQSKKSSSSKRRGQNQTSSHSRTHQRNSRKK